MNARNSLLFEGSNLEEVLAEAKLVFGPDVEIEAANRIRKGGIMGFFATEWYEVWARSTSPGPVTTAAPATATPAALADHATATPAGLADHATATPAALADHATATPAALRQLEREGDADTFQSMVQNALAERHGAGHVPTDYEQALDRFFGPEEAPTAASMSTPSTTATTTMERPAPAPGLASTPLSNAAPAPRRRLTPVVETVKDQSVPAVVALEDPPRGATVFEEPPAPARTELLWAMLDRLDAVPAAPPPPPGPGLVVFVGSAALALDVARRQAATSPRWTGDVVVLSRRTSIDGVPDWLLVNHLEEALERAARWRQKDGLVAIVIDIELDQVIDRKWAIEALTALDATQVRLTTEAWRLPDDVGRIAGKLGGVDMLDLVAVTDAIEPLAMLDLEIPVATIEGRTASPELMAAVYLENRRAH